MNHTAMKIVILGLSITSSWGNGHSTTYRALVRALAQRGHHVLFLERDVPWYAENRDLPNPPYGRTMLYSNLRELKRSFCRAVAEADLVIVGSFVPEGIAVGEWVVKTARGLTAFYDIDTPVTLARLRRGQPEYLSAGLIPRYDMYLSFTGGPILDLIERKYRSPFARPLYCSFDPLHYFPEPCETKWDLGYMGTHSNDRQPSLETLMLCSAEEWGSGKFVVAGPLYPKEINWPGNVQRIEHLPPGRHRCFYNAQRFTLNLTRAEMIRAGYSPSVRLFEAAACGTPIISDSWEGLGTFLEPGKEILISSSSEESTAYIRDMPERERIAIGHAARRRVLACHTAEHRAAEIEEFVGLHTSGRSMQLDRINSAV